MKQAAARENWRNFYGRRYGKRLRPAQKARLERDLPKYSIPEASLEHNPERLIVDLKRLFPFHDQIWLEIGFGSGEHLLNQASLRPNVGLIGCEPYVNGVAALLGTKFLAGVSNIRLHPGDVRDLLDVLPNSSLGRAFALYPDPWPKTRHHRRRLVAPEYLQPLARVLKSGSQLRIATDVADFARQAVEQIHVSRDFTWHPIDNLSWRSPWPGWQPTRYEIKALAAGRTPIYLTFLRN